MDTLDTINEENTPRPKFLTVLCILTFISTGMSLVSGLYNLLFVGKQSQEAMLETKVAMAESISELKNLGMSSLVDMMEKIDRMSIEINDNFYLASMISLVTVGIGLFGAFKMWNGFKIGFHLYIVYNLLIVGAIYLYVSPGNIPTFVVIFNVFFSALFVFMYSRNLKWMN
jgi:hypothetical protein